MEEEKKEKKNTQKKVTSKKNNKTISIKNKKTAKKELPKASKNTKKESTTKKIQKKQSTKPVEKKSSTSTKLTKAEEKEILSKSKKVEKNKQQKEKAKKEKKKREEKTKLVLPKEWEQINKQKQKKKTTKEKVSSNTQKLGILLKDSLFEEVDEQTFIIERKENRKKTAKILIIIAIIAIVLGLGIFFLIKYNEHVKQSLRIYDLYEIGDVVELKDSSRWYVIEKSDKDNSTIKVLKETQIDINKDGTFNDADKKKYNSTGNSTYDNKDTEGVAYYLENEYKKDLEEQNGKIEEVSLLTSKEFVKVRNKMGYGYEWTTNNWLANTSLDTWWVISEQNKKIFSVTRIGSYKLYNPTDLNYVRPTIVIKKELINVIKD